MVYRELASLLTAGIPLDKALSLLIDTPELQAARLRIAAIRDQVREGAGLSAAMVATGGSLSEMERAVLQSAERTGALGSMLERLADFMDEADALRERVQSALIYPSVVVAFGLCVSIVMLGVLLPRMQGFLGEAQAELPAITRAMLAVGRFGSTWGGLVLLLLGAGAVAAVLRLRGDRSLRIVFERRLAAVPVAGRGFCLLANLRFARTFSELLQAGIPAIDAFALSGRATGSAWVESMVEREAEQVRHGDPLSDALARIHPLAETLPGWVRVGEASGSLADLLGAAADRYEGRWTRFVSRGLTVLEPVLIALIGGFVLLVTLAVLLPILDMTTSVAP
jgi:general secretion pathway protein F